MEFCLLLRIFKLIFKILWILIYSNNWKPPREYHASEKEEILLPAMFRLQAGLECLSRRAFNRLIL